MLMRNFILSVLILCSFAIVASADGKDRFTDAEILVQIFNYNSWNQVSRTEPNIAGGSFEIAFSAPGGG